MEKRQYRSAQRSRRQIREAFAQLLQEKAFERISVTEIVQRADLNRSTFYAHYQDIWALVEEYENEVVDRTIALTKQQYANLFGNPLPFLREVTRPLEQNRELYRLLAKNSRAPQQMESIRQLFVEFALSAPELPEALRSSAEFQIQVEFFIGGIFGVYKKWIEGGWDCPIDVVSQKVAEIIRSSTRTFLENRK